MKKFDLHVHSHFSLDAFPSPQKIVKKAVRQNLGVAIADHNVINGSLQAIELGQAAIIPAFESLTKDGIHALFFFPSGKELSRFYQEQVKPFLSPQLMLDKTVKQLIGERRKYDCIIGWPHPFQITKGGCQRLVKKNLMAEAELIKMVDFIEVKNGSAGNQTNQRAEVMAKQYGKTATGGSDAHLLWEVGSTYTELEADSVQQA
ncbi:PHP domain-containing protein, partial [Patescibacteria group bacterium]|nr:PHP domain-containing protein [Patescibacteria group bacterium]